MRVWPGDAPFSWRATSSLEEGAPFESTCFSASAHAGTHADAPAHVLRGGARAGSLDLKPYVGPARVLPLDGHGEVGPDSLSRFALGVSRVLFQTGGRAFLSPLAAIRLAEAGAILIGTDAPSIDPNDAPDLPAHGALLSRGVALLEDLALEHVAPGDYWLVALPLKLEDLDASPVRAVLLVES
jgi:arylformamidase